MNIIQQLKNEIIKIEDEISSIEVKVNNLEKDTQNLKEKISSTSDDKEITKLVNLINLNKADINELKVDKKELKAEKIQKQEKLEAIEKKTENITCTLISNLKESLHKLTDNSENINTNNLKAILEKQAHEIFGRKIPVHHDRYNNTTRLQETLVSDIEINYNLLHNFQTIYEFSIYANINYSECETEAQYCFALDSLVYSTFVQYFNQSKEQIFKVHLDKSFSLISDSTHSKTNIKKLLFNNHNIRSKNVALMRPDLCISDTNGRVVLKGEFKQRSENISKAKEEISIKSFVTNKELYSNNKFGSFAFVAAGHIFQLFYLSHINQICDCSNLILSCNLNILNQRVKLIKDLLCLCNLMELFSIKNPTNIYYDFFARIENTEKTRIIQYGLNNTVIKRVKKDWIEEFSKFDIYFNKLQNFYQILSEGKIKNSINFILIKETADYLCIVTEPICENNIQYRIKTLNDFKDLFQSVLEAVQSMHLCKFAHCDIRWPNIVYDCINSKYLLIDFENVEHLCDSKCNILSKNHECIRPENDFKMIAHLIDNLTNVFIKEEDKIFVSKFKDLLSSKKTINPILNFLTKI